MKWRRAAVACSLLLLGLAAVTLPVRVAGNSMEPTYHDGDLLLTLPAWGAIKQGDVVVFTPPAGFKVAHARQSDLIKRVVGLPGQVRRENSQPAVEVSSGGGETKSTPATHTESWGFGYTPAVGLPAQHYFLIGDNPESSIDSRQFGAVPQNRIHRRVVGRIWSSGTAPTAAVVLQSHGQSGD
ncbi:MAG: signal peptidase I [Planctomycetes bacterium]|nr:signal peptidase I [Planctomycetota bacterium]